jgi:uncharacterized protein (TIGR04255 family)
LCIYTDAATRAARWIVGWMMSELPARLKPDAIVEALMEVRFETSSFPEMTIGSLVAGQPWKGFRPVRLPAAEIPHVVRMNDPNLKFQPTIQLNSQDGFDAIKIGENVLSIHRLETYPGWATFGPQLHAALRQLYQLLPDLNVTRLGFRYVNMLHHQHGVESINDLDVSLSVGGESLRPPINLNYLRHVSATHHVMVRAASPEFVQGPQTRFAALIDIDVFSPGEPELNKIEDCDFWLEEAHSILKQRFFELLDSKTIERLRD